MEKKNCAIIGEPPMCFPWGYDEEDEACCALKLMMLNQISMLQTQGITRFVVPLDDGIGLYAAEIINSLRETNPALELICLIPWENQAVKWSPELRERYYRVLEQCTDSKIISGDYTAACEIETAMQAIDTSQQVLAVCSAQEKHTSTLAMVLHYAKKLGRDVTHIYAPKL